MPASHRDTSEKINRATEAAGAAARTVADETANTSQQTARVGAEIAKNGAETVQQIVQSSVEMATQATQRSVEQVAQVLGFPGRQSEETARQSSQNIEIVAEASTVLAQGIQEISREWMSLAQDRFRRNLDGFGELLRCRTLPDFIAVQSGLMRDNLEQILSNSRRIAELSVQVSEQAAQKIAAQTREHEKQARRSA